MWNTWGQCTTTCAEGTRSRSRSCSNPPVSSGGKSCSGQHVETEKCNKDIPCSGKQKEIHNYSGI